LIKVKIKGNQLHIINEKSISPTKLVVDIMMPKIEGLSVVGSGEIYSKYPIRSENIKLNVSGSGDIKLDNVISDNITADVVGSGDIECYGSAINADLLVKGSGDISMRKFTVSNCNANTSGSGDIKITATDNFNAKVTGSGDIVYWGNPPRVVQQISGSGSITQGR